MNDSVWIIAPEHEKAHSLSAELNIPLEIAQLLVNRNIRDKEAAHRFLFGSLDDLHDPFLMKGMKEAAECIKTAISRKDKILIFGDYDVDGVLSVVILSKALESLGASVDFFIPNRLSEGYGIKDKHLAVALQRAANLVVSVDCGIKAVKFAREAQQNGLNLIITDHHLPGKTLPAAHAILNPLVEDCGYPDKNLAGIGVVFKLIQALFESEGKSSLLPHYLKMVSIGTIADIAALDGENRLLVKYGLEGLKKVSNIGLMQLLDVCGLNGKKVSVGDVGFKIGPRINAAGRMGQTDLAVRLFFSDSVQEAGELVRLLDALNSKRQQVEERIYNQARDKIIKESLDKKHKLLVLGSEEWHRGVIGIVASKLKEDFHRPVLLLAYEDGKAMGSGRSISEFSLIGCLEESRNLLSSYGGHTLAVGCELAREDVDSFKKTLNDYAETRITEEHLKRKISIDARLDFQSIDSSFLENLEFLAPFGVGNPRPVFLSESVEVISHPKKIQQKHSKFLVKQKGRIFEAIGWRRGDWADEIRRGDCLDIAYTLHFSEYLGEERLTLSLEDIKSA